MLQMPQLAQGDFAVVGIGAGRDEGRNLRVPTGNLSGHKIQRIDTGDDLRFIVGRAVTSGRPIISSGLDGKRRPGQETTKCERSELATPGTSRAGSLRFRHDKSVTAIENDWQTQVLVTCTRVARGSLVRAKTLSFTVQ